MPEMSFFLPLVLQSAIVPLLVALAVLAACRGARLQAMAPVLALATGFLASYAATLHAQWSPLPHVALDWLPWIVVIGALAAWSIEKIASRVARIAARGLAGAVVGALVVASALESLGVAKAALTALVVAVLVALAWTAMARPARGRATRPLLLALVAGGTGLALMLDSSQAIGQLSGGLACALAACVLFALARSHTGFPPAAAGLAVLTLAVLLANAHVFAAFPLQYVALLVAALLADPGLAALRRLRRSDAEGLGWIPAAVLTAVPVVLTIALAVKAAQESGGY
jgi:hypothetical protein